MGMTNPVHGNKTSLAQRKRQSVRKELAGAALKMLAYQWFEGTTIDQMAAAAGVSRRTFFRYFEPKGMWSCNPWPTRALSCRSNSPPGLIGPCLPPARPMDHVHASNVLWLFCARG